MGARHDAIVVGAGHNGLTAACYLAKAGLRVLVVEKSAWVGGAAVSRELHPGWTYSNCSYVCSLLRPEIVRDLDLPRFGLQVIPYESGATFTPDGGYFAYYADHDALRREIRRFSWRDADNYERYAQAVLRQCRFIRPLLLRTPPDPVALRPRDVGELLFLGRRFHDLGRREMGEAIRFWTMSIGDFLDQYFESRVIKAHLAGSGIIGTGLGVCSPGTAYVLLHHYMGDVDGAIGAWGFARGGMGSVTRAMAAALQASGGEIRTGSGVERFLVRNGRVTGVALENGDELEAPVVVSGMDVKRTFLRHVGPEHLPEEFAGGRAPVQDPRLLGQAQHRAGRHARIPGGPEGCAVPQGRPALLGIARRPGARLRRLEGGALVGRALLRPADPDPDRPDHGAARQAHGDRVRPVRPLRAERRAELGRRDARGLRRHGAAQDRRASPNFRELVVHMEVRTPKDIEDEVGLTEGNIFQGELTFDQLLFNRPVPGWAQYRSPVRGLYTCGSSNHPGGGVMGAPGANAAREILRDLGRARVGRAA